MNPPVQSTTLACLKGLALTTTLYTTTHLQTLTLHLPALYTSAEHSHKLAAQQFAHFYRVSTQWLAPAEILSALLCSALAYISFQDKGARGLGWKLWVGAAVGLTSTLPLVRIGMDKPAQKLLWVSEVASSATTPATPSSGIGMKVTDEGSSLLGVPQGSKDGTITPAEEFEPFEDAIIGDEYEQLKVRMLVKRYRNMNIWRTVAGVVAVGLGGWAAVFE